MRTRRLHRCHPTPPAADGDAGAIQAALVAEAAARPQNVPDMLNATDQHGLTPLSWAACMGHEHVVRLLLAQGGIIPDPREEHVGWTPLLLASARGHEGVVRLLLP